MEETRVERTCDPTAACISACDSGPVSSRQAECRGACFHHTCFALSFVTLRPEVNGGGVVDTRVERGDVICNEHPSYVSEHHARSACRKVNLSGDKHVAGQHSESGGSMCSHAEYTQDTRTAVTLCAHAWGRGPGQARDAVCAGYATPVLHCPWYRDQMITAGGGRDASHFNFYTDNSIRKIARRKLQFSYGK